MFVLQRRCGHTVEISTPGDRRSHCYGIADLNALRIRFDAHGKVPNRAREILRRVWRERLHLQCGWVTLDGDSFLLPKGTEGVGEKWIGEWIVQTEDIKGRG